jgi:hypothetical protein
LPGRSAGLSCARGPSSGQLRRPRRPARPRRTTADQPTGGSPTRLETLGERRPEAPTEQARAPQADPARPASPSPWAALRGSLVAISRLFVGATARPRNAPPPDPDNFASEHTSTIFLGLQHERPGGGGHARRSVGRRRGRARWRTTWWASGRSGAVSAPAETEVPRSIRHLCVPGAGCPIEHSAPDGRHPTPRRSIAGVRHGHFNGHLGIPQRGPSRPRVALIPGVVRPPFSPASERVNGLGFSPVAPMKFPTGGDFLARGRHVLARFPAKPRP